MYVEIVQLDRLTLKLSLEKKKKHVYLFNQ